MRKFLKIFPGILIFISIGKGNVVAQNSATEKLSLSAMIDSIIKLNPAIIMYDANENVGGIQLFAPSVCACMDFTFASYMIIAGFNFMIESIIAERDNFSIAEF